jgi:hypothetical protein
MRFGPEKLDGSQLVNLTQITHLSLKELVCSLLAVIQGITRVLLNETNYVSSQWSCNGDKWPKADRPLKSARTSKADVRKRVDFQTKGRGSGIGSLVFPSALTKPGHRRYDQEDDPLAHRHQRPKARKAIRDKKRSKAKLDARQDCLEGRILPLSEDPEAASQPYQNQGNHVP